MVRPARSPRLRRRHSCSQPAPRLGPLGAAQLGGPCPKPLGEGRAAGVLAGWRAPRQGPRRPGRKVQLAVARPSASWVPHVTPVSWACAEGPASGAAAGTCPPGSRLAGPRASLPLIRRRDATAALRAGRRPSAGRRLSRDLQTPLRPPPGSQPTMALSCGRLAMAAAPLQERGSVRRPPRRGPPPCALGGLREAQGVGAVGGLATFPPPSARGARGCASPLSWPLSPAPVGPRFQTCAHRPLVFAADTPGALARAPHAEGRSREAGACSGPAAPMAAVWFSFGRVRERGKCGPEDKPPC